ncbi:MAG: CARDB domain-containing protein, partial [Solirubrobacteraceae bacterium]
PGLHGHGLLGVSVGSLTLQPGQANRIPASSSLSFSVKIANQGDNAESDVRVRVRIRGGGGDPITVQKVVDQTMAKTETTVAIPLGKAPPIAQAVTIVVDVLPVPGEKNTTNNTSTYTAIFERN